ncbi:MAG: hypothetical protein EOM25_13545 [Deltaproteobacteria bacterium]|nr:hypothetical protein [Deltaproteobacteria bacterium]
MRSNNKSSIEKKNADLSEAARDRHLAKLGMSVSMGVLIFTGFHRTRETRPWHVLAGASLVGFSIWHHMLYKPRSGASS